MERMTFDVLFVGPQGPFREIIDHLAEEKKYRLHFAPNYEGARALINEHAPETIILAMRGDEQALAIEMEWLDIMRKDAPVLLLSSAEDSMLHLTALENGAFDFVTTSTPLDMVDWIVNNAVSSRSWASKV